VKNIKWVLSNVKENGWIEEMGFYKGDESPLTHTIAYTLRGLLEASFLLDDEMRQKTRGVVIKAGEKLHEIYETFRGIPNKKIDLLPARISSDWKPAANYSCLTGNAQIAIIWFKLFQLTRETKFFTAAQRISESLKMTHDLKARNKGIRGAISGSLPVWGGYLQFAYPNWAAKFFADALMIQEKILKENPEMALNQKQVTQ
jgi:hypothetical protein